MSHRSARLRTARRAAALLLFVSFGLAPVWQAAHLSLVRHTTCPEHGELVELAGEVAQAHTATPRGWTSDASQAPADLHGHDHCVVLSARTQSVARPAHCPDLDGSVERAIIAAAPVDAWSTTGIAVLRLAPKASPPVQA